MLVDDDDESQQVLAASKTVRSGRVGV